MTESRTRRGGGLRIIAAQGKKAENQYSLVRIRWLGRR